MVQHKELFEELCELDIFVKDNKIINNMLVANRSHTERKWIKYGKIEKTRNTKMYLFTHLFETIPRVRPGFNIGAHDLYCIRYPNVTVLLGGTKMKGLNLNCKKIKYINVSQMNISTCESWIWDQKSYNYEKLYIYNVLKQRTGNMIPNSEDAFQNCFQNIWHLGSHYSLIID